MKRITSLAFSFFLLISCSNNDKAGKPTEPGRKQSSQSTTDKELQAWMQGKLWKADEGMAPFRQLKLHKSGLCEFYQGPSDQWSIQGERFVLNRLTEWPVKKVDDSTFSLYVKPTDKTFLFRHKESF